MLWCLYSWQCNRHHLGPIQFLLSFCWPYPGLYCVVNHFFVIKGFWVNRYCLIIIRTRWPPCSISPQTMMKIFADVFLASTYQACTPVPEVYHKIVSMAPCQCAVQLWMLPGHCSAQSRPVSELPYNQWIHWLDGAACLIFQSQDTLSVPWALFVPSILQTLPEVPTMF